MLVEEASVVPRSAFQLDGVLHTNAYVVDFSN